MQRWIVAIVIWAATAVTISAQTLVIPVSANADRVNQTKLRTDLQVKTQGDAAAPFTIELLETGADNSEPTTMDRSIAAGESLRLGNVLETGFGFAGTSELRITATDGGIPATSRTHNDDPDDTYGRPYPPLPKGTFRVGPAVLQSMYAPEFTAYSASHRLEVEAN